MKVSKKEVSLILLLLGIAITYCSYQFVYLRFKDEAASLRSQASSLQTEIIRLEEIKGMEEQYRQEIEDMNKEIEGYMSYFPSNVIPEDEIKLIYTLDHPEEDSYLFFNSINFGTPNSIYQTVQLESPSEEIVYPVYALYETQNNFSMECDYGTLKELVENLYNQSGRRALQTVMLSYNEETGRLTGNMAMSSYFALGQEKPYVSPELAPVEQGTDNIFGSAVSAQPAAPVATTTTEAEGTTAP